MDKIVRKNIIAYTLMRNVFIMVLAFLLLAIAWHYGGDKLAISENIIINIFTFIFIFSLFICFIPPFIHVKTWRCEVSEVALIYTKGFFIIRKAVIPMSKIQNITTTTNPLLKKFNLVELSVQTLTKTHRLYRISINEGNEIILKINTILKEIYLKDLNASFMQKAGNDAKE